MEGQRTAGRHEEIMGCELLERIGRGMEKRSWTRALNSAGQNWEKKVKKVAAASDDRQSSSAGEMTRNRVTSVKSRLDFFLC
jgi:hypothetical protein